MFHDFGLAVASRNPYLHRRTAIITFRQMHPFPHERAAEPRLPHDGRRRTTRGLKAFDEMKPFEVQRALRHDAVVLIDDYRTAAPREHPRAAPRLRDRGGLVGDDQKPTLSGQFLFDGLAQVEYEVKAIGDLVRLRCAAADALGIGAMPIAADGAEVGCAASQVATASAVRTANTSTTRRRSKSTTIVP
jgi:hypothetical protein